MSALVTIIVPIYNAKKTLSRCLDSLLKQTYDNIEVLLIDNGSKDGSYEICKYYAENYNCIRVYHAICLGVSRARNCGLVHAKGEYILFVDSDDYVREDYVSVLINAMEISDSDLVICDFWYVNNKKEYHNHPIRYGQISISEYLKMLIEDPYGFYHGVVWNKCYKSSIIKDNNLYFDEKIEVYEDFAFNLNYLQHVHMLYLESSIVYWYVFYNNSLSNKGQKSSSTLEKKYQGTITIFIDYKQLLFNNELYGKYCNKINSYIYEFFIAEKIRLLWGYHSIPRKECIQCLHKLKMNPVIVSGKKEMKYFYRLQFGLRYSIYISLKYIKNKTKQKSKIYERRVQ